MFCNISLFTLTVFTLFFTSSVEGMESYAVKVIDLGLEREDSEALSVNDRGQIAGVFWTTRYAPGLNNKLIRIKENHHLFIWDETNGRIDGKLPYEIEQFGENGGVELMLNEAGLIAGVTKDRKHAFFWDPSAGFVELNSQGGSRIFVTDMNDLGQIVGWFETEENPFNSFLWKEGEMTDLTKASSERKGNDGFPIKIDNDGEIIFWNDAFISSFIPEEDFNDYLKNNIYYDAINNAGQVLYTVIGNNFLGDKLVSYKGDYPAKPVEFPWFYPSQQRVRMNDRGDIVSSIVAYVPEKEGSDYQQINLGFVLPPLIWHFSTFEYPGSDFTFYNTGPYAYDINNKGWIVGSGFDWTEGRKALIWKLNGENQ